ncbi:MAG: PBP1A family penicillin-binding protein [Hyphomicrobiaceae bacterium]
MRAGVCAGIAIMVLLSVQFIRYTIKFPDPRALSINEAGPIVRILARDGSVLAERGERNAFIKFDQMPRHLVNAVVATEDRRFYDHWGLDPSGLLRAALANLRAGRTVQGGSTLTQQLAKNLFLSTERTLSRKLDELVLSLWLELRLTKRDILELYLNRVYFGGGAYGVEAAARRYFNKPARSVTVAEAAVIAGLLKAPSKYSPLTNPGYARARARIVLQAMQAAGFLSPGAHAAAKRHSVRFADPNAGRKTTGLEYAVDYVLDHLPPIASVGRREVIVETTIDAALQKQAQSTVARVLAARGKTDNVDQAAMAVIDTSGGLRALVGGRSFAESQFNRATKSRRQPGSAFKPLVYLAALEHGMTPQTLVSDAPIEINGWSPRNDDGRYRGPITIAQALARSVNTIAVRLQQEVGGQAIEAVASRLGIRSKLRPDASMALGTSEVGLLELVGAYGVFAAGGQAIAPYAISRIRLDDGQIIYEHRTTPGQTVVAPTTVGDMNTMLNGAVVFGTGRRAALHRHQVAGKTGTTQDFRDAWFVGYTSHLVGGVWFGNDDGSPMKRVTGGGLPAEVWRDVMAPAHADLPPRTLPGIDPEQEAQPAIGPMRLREDRNTQPTTAAAARASPAVVVPPLLPRRASARQHTVAKPRDIAKQPGHALTRPAPKPAKPFHRMPSEPIDADLFARALAPEPPVAAAADTASATAAKTQRLDYGRLREALTSGAEPRMGLGANR